MEELERTYLTKEIPQDLLQFPSKVMLDIYLPSTSAHPGLRIRRRGDTLEITKKRPLLEGDTSRQNEQTILLAEDEYQELSSIPGKRVSKVRYFYKQSGTDFEVDVFTGDLQGLVLVDVEFSSSQTRDSFVMPSFCLAEVTQEAFVAGGMLCGKKYSEIEPNLKKFGYKKLSLNNKSLWSGQ